MAIARAILKILEGYAKSAAGGAGQRRLKPGTEIVREFQGERHTVVVTRPTDFGGETGNTPA